MIQFPSRSLSNQPSRCFGPARSHVVVESRLSPAAFDLANNDESQAGKPCRRTISRASLRELNLETYSTCSIRPGDTIFRRDAGISTKSGCPYGNAVYEPNGNFGTGEGNRQLAARLPIVRLLIKHSNASAGRSSRTTRGTSGPKALIGYEKATKSTEHVNKTKPSLVNFSRENLCRCDRIFGETTARTTRSCPTFVFVAGYRSDPGIPIAPHGDYAIIVSWQTKGLRVPGAGSPAVSHGKHGAAALSINIK